MESNHPFSRENPTYRRILSLQSRIWRMWHCEDKWGTAEFVAMCRELESIGGFDRPYSTLNMAEVWMDYWAHKRQRIAKSEIGRHLERGERLPA